MRYVSFLGTVALPVPRVRVWHEFLKLLLYDVSSCVSYTVASSNSQRFYTMASTVVSKWSVDPAGAVHERS